MNPDGCEDHIGYVQQGMLVSKRFFSACGDSTVNVSQHYVTKGVRVLLDTSTIVMRIGRTVMYSLLDGIHAARGKYMIKLTRLDGEPFVLNADLIRYIERRPDTFITLVSGERIVVGESMDVVIELAVQYQQQKHFMPMPTASLTATSVSTPATN